ncbi:hypothetical protein ALC60_04189 [Trachymyrmex zeteki]|uniref:Uncharacterized protein n=1 Tax=Mycetomoellerius zeteki TaxID=64791 RepID=A0A151X903_9HYME|nr:hypothetical protein ALC60_04189 [Trachymyrmex zeteki]
MYLCALRIQVKDVARKSNLKASLSQTKNHFPMRVLDFTYHFSARINVNAELRLTKLYFILHSSKRERKNRTALRMDVDIGGANCSSNDALLPTPPSPTTTNLKVIRLSLFGGRVILPLDPLLLLRPLLRLPILPTLLTCLFSSANTCRMANCLFNPKGPVTIRAFRKFTGISSEKMHWYHRNALAHCRSRVKVRNEKLCGKNTIKIRHRRSEYAKRQLLPSLKLILQ